MEAVRAKVKRLADNYLAKQQEVLAEILPQNVSGGACAQGCSPP